MKSLFALLTFCFSVTCFGAGKCPYLVGHWKCQNADSTVSIFSITQYNIENGVYYELLASDGKASIRADGVPRTYTDDKGSVEILAQCTDPATVHLEIKAVSLDQTASALEEMDIISVNAGNMQTRGSLTETHGGHSTTKDLSSHCFNVHESFFTQPTLTGGIL